MEEREIGLLEYSSRNIWNTLFYHNPSSVRTQRWLKKILKLPYVIDELAWIRNWWIKKNKSKTANVNWSEWCYLWVNLIKCPASQSQRVQQGLANGALGVQQTLSRLCQDVDHASVYFRAQNSFGKRTNTRCWSTAHKYVWVISIWHCSSTKWQISSGGEYDK